MKYTQSQMRKLGLDPSYAYFPCFLASKSTRDELSQKILGRFRNIIHSLFTSDDGNLDNDYLNSGTESASPDVQRFFSNWLLKPVKPLPGCSSHEEALNLVISRNAQSSEELAPYMQKFEEIVKTEFDKSKNSQSNPSTNGPA